MIDVFLKGGWVVFGDFGEEWFFVFLIFFVYVFLWYFICVFVCCVGG